MSGYRFNRDRPEPPAHLVDMLPPRPSAERSLRIHEIKKLVAKKFNVTVADLDGKRCHQGVTRPRHVAFWICRNGTKNSLPKIGREFGGRNHATVINGVMSVDAQLMLDVELWDDIRDILAQLDELAAPEVEAESVDD